MKEQERQREADAAIAAYSKKKAEMIAERERREGEKRALKEADRKRIADQIESKYLEFMGNEEHRLARDVAAAEEKSAADEASRRQRIKDTLAAMDTSNQLQLRQKAEARRKQQAEEAEQVAEWSGRVKELKAEEEAEKRARRDASRKVAEYQQHQAELRARRAAQSKIQDMEVAAQIQHSLALAEDTFQSYAQEMRTQYRADQKPTAPVDLWLSRPDASL